MSQFFKPSSGGGGGTGDVVGPASSADNNIAVFDGITGKLIKDTSISSISPTFTGDVSTLSNLNLPTTSATVGRINMNSIRYIHSGLSLTNFFAGSQSGNLTNTATGSVGLGQLSLTNLTSGASNTAIGVSSGQSLTTGTFNTAIGALSGSNGLSTGTRNVLVGYRSGFSYTGAESSNVLVGSEGVIGESNVLRIGQQGAGAGQQSTAYVAGITGATVAASQPVAVNSTGQLSGLGFGTSGQVLTSTGAASSPTWQAAGGGGGGSSYSIYLLSGSSQSNPIDNFTYYAGFSGNWVTAAVGIGISLLYRYFIPKSGTITACVGAIFIGTPGSAEPVTVAIRVNDTTNYIVTSTLPVNTTYNAFSNLAMSAPVVAGDFITFAVITPVWVTNPGSMSMGVSAFIS